MKKILILTLAIWTGAANFAYASARVECASMMMDHDCCPKPVACQCAIQMPTSDRSVPVSSPVFFGQISWAPADNPEIEPVQPSQFQKFIRVFPPGQPPLYELFSVYRL